MTLPLSTGINLDQSQKTIDVSGMIVSPLYVPR